MSYVPGLAIALAALWLALSGEMAPMFLMLGALSVLLALWLAARLGIIDRDSSPYHRVVLLLAYLAWLIVEIVKANITVIGKIMGPRHAIDPVMVKVNAGARTDLGRALFANSITLTPGTVTVEIVGVELVVHALVRENARAHTFAPMDRRAARAADKPADRPAGRSAGRPGKRKT